MRKIFTFLCAALMSVGMFAATEVTITDSDFPAWGESFTKDGVTVSAEMIDGMYGNISGPGSFSTTLGNFTKIEIFAEDVSTISGEGWSGDSEHKTWTGNASSVSFTGDIMGNEEGTTLKFTIETAPSAKFYVVGDMTNWAVNADYEMTPSNVRVDEVEEYMYDITLTTSNQFKVVKVEGETQTWYPDGMGNNYGEHGEIERDGDYTIYFRPALDGDEDWFYNCIFALRHLVYEKVILGALFPENGMPENGINLQGSFTDEDIAMNLVEETGAYAVFDLEAADEDVFSFVDANDPENVLVMRNAAGEWVPAVFTFDEVWEDDTWKGEPVKMIDMDLTDNSKYAWANAIPEGLEEVLSEKAESTKVMIDGMLYIVRDGKMFNVLGTEVK